MQSTKRAPLRRLLAGIVTGALFASAAVAGVALPAQAAEAPATGGSLVWGMDQTYLSVFTTRANEAPATWSDGNTLANYPVDAAASAYDRSTQTGTIAFSGAARAGYFAGAPVPGVSDGNYFYLKNPRIVIDGTTGSLVAGTVAGSSHSLSGDLPTHAGTDVTIATLDLSAGATQTSTTVSWSDVPVAITAEGASYFAQYATAGDAAPTVRAAGSALEPLSFSITTDAVAQATQTQLTSPAAGASAEQGTSVTFAATVTPVGAAGTVSFRNDGVEFATASVNTSDGTASTTYDGLAVGAASITAVFEPADADAYEGSTSDAANYTVTPTAVVPAGPVLTVTPSTSLTVGQTVTVTGSGYNPNQPIYVAICTDIPLEDLTFAFIAAGCTAGAKQVTLNPTSGTQVQFNADGSFETTLAVSPKAGSTAVYTLANHTAMNDRSQDAKVTLQFAAEIVDPPVDPPVEPATPVVTVTPDADLDPSVQNVLTVSGTGFTGTGAANGAYVLFGETSVWDGAGPLPASGWITSTHVGEITDGAFTTTLTIPAGVLDPSKQYQVATSAAHELSATDRSLDTFTAVTVAQGVPAEPKAIIGNSGATVAQGGTLTLTGTGFVSGAEVTAVVRSVTDPVGTATANQLGTVEFSWPVPADFAATTHVVDLSVNGVVLASASFAVTAVVTPPEEPEQPVCLASEVSDATIDWGVKQSFRDYITGPIANGSISTSDGYLRLSSGTGAYSTEANEGRVSYSGSIHYEGHDGALDVTLSDPVVQVDSATSATLYVTTQGTGRIAFADLSLPTASTTSSSISWSDASATLTAAGSQVFSYNGGSFYPAGTELDPVSFSFPLGALVDCVDPGDGDDGDGDGGSDNGDDGSDDGDGGSTSAQPTISGTLAQSGTVTFTVPGFQAGEQVLAVAHSTPVTIGTFTADAQGVVTIVWTIPRDFEAGEHTLILTGDRGTYIEVPFAVAAVCLANAVSGATIDWGFKQSFVDYIQGPIANGAISGGWGTGAGAYSVENDGGSVRYNGSVRYTGHSGVLDITLASLRIQVTGPSTAVLYATTASTGEIALANLSLPAAVRSGDGISWGNASASLTAAGSQLFSYNGNAFYPAGTALDPVSFSFPLGAEIACDSTTDGSLAVTGGSDAAGALWLGAALLVLGAGMVVLRRRRAARS